MLLINNAFHGINDTNLLWIISHMVDNSSISEVGRDQAWNFSKSAIIVIIVKKGMITYISAILSQIKKSSTSCPKSL